MINLKNIKITRKVILYPAILLVLLLLTLLGFRIMNTPYLSGLPATDDLRSYTDPVQDQIVEATRKARLNPSAGNLGELGMVYQSCADYEKAAECYKLAVKKNSSKWIWNYYLGYMYRELGESENAIAAFVQIVKEHPEVWHAWFYLGEGFYKRGSYDEAEMSFSKIPLIRQSENSGSRTDLFPLEVHAKYQRARIQLSKNDLQRTENLLQEIIETSNTYGPAYRLLANVYSIRGDSSWGKYYIMRANDLADYSPPVDTLVDRIARISRSELYLMKQIDEAVKSYNTDWTMKLLNNAINNTRDNKHVISKAVKAYLKMDQDQQAIALLPKHLQLFSSDIAELKEVAGLLNNKNMYDQSLNYFTLLVNLKPSEPEYVSGKALALSGNKKKDEALKLISDFTNKNRNNADAIKEAIYFLIVEGETLRAKELLAHLRSIAPLDDKIFKYEGMIYDYEDKTDQSIAAYEIAFRKDPSDLATIQYLGNNLVKQKMWRKALDHFRKGMEYHPNDPYLLERVGTLLATCQDKNLRNYGLAKEFAERAYINIGASPETMISAGRTLGLTYYATGDKANAAHYFNIALNLARESQYPPEMLKEIEDLLQKLQM